MKKRGFTLIELLAVIIILAIVAVITMPIVMKIIDDVQMNSVKETANGILESAKIHLVTNSSDINKTIDVTGSTLKYKGAKPEEGYVRIDEKGKEQIYIYSKGYCASKRYDGSINVSKKSKEECNYYTNDEVQEEKGITTMYDNDSKYIKDLRIYGKTSIVGTPSPDSPATITDLGNNLTIKVSGKNLIHNYTEWVSNTASCNISGDTYTIVSSSSGSYRQASTVPQLLDQVIPSGKKVVLSATSITGQGGFIVRLFSGSSQFGEISINSSHLSSSFTLTKDLTEIRMVPLANQDVSVNVGTETIINGIQLEVGDSPTSYEQYNEPVSTTINLAGEQLKCVNDFCDYIDYENNRIVRNIGKKEFNGTETYWGKNTDNGDYMSFLYPSISLNKSQDNDHIQVLSTHAQYAWWNEIPAGNYWWSAMASTGMRINKSYLTNYDSLTTNEERINAFKSWLAGQYDNGTPVTIYYALANPTYESIELPLINTFSSKQYITVIDGSNVNTNVSIMK